MTAGLPDALLEAALARAPAEGWTQAMLSRAAGDAGLDAGALALHCPDGPISVLAHYSARLDGAMVEALAAAAPEALRVRARITRGIRARIEAMTPHREAARRAAALLALPPYAPQGLRLAYDTVDRLWRAAGDKATDFNFYTKRALAGGVYLSTLATWFADRSPDYAETWRHLDQRIDAVMLIEGAKVQARRFAAYFPSPWALLGALRYGQRTERAASEPANPPPDSRSR